MKVTKKEEEEGEGVEGRHTLSIGLILLQLPTTTKRAVRIFLNGSNLVSTKPTFLVISSNLLFPSII